MVERNGRQAARAAGIVRVDLDSATPVGIFDDCPAGNPQSCGPRRSLPGLSCRRHCTTASGSLGPVVSSVHQDKDHPHQAEKPGDRCCDNGAQVRQQPAAVLSFADSPLRPATWNSFSHRQSRRDRPPARPSIAVWIGMALERGATAMVARLACRSLQLRLGPSRTTSRPAAGHVPRYQSFLPCIRP
jgi:hypothetical protein